VAIARALLAAAFLGAIAAYLGLAGSQHVSTQALVEHREALLRLAHENAAIALAVAFVVYAGAIALSLPGALVLALASGLLFGRLVGTAVAIAAETLGATLIFLAARHWFAAPARRRIGASARRFDDGFTRHGFYYLLCLRVVPILPFCLVNLAAAFTSVRLATYVLATLLGVAPVAFVCVAAGEGLRRIDSLADLPSFDVPGALALLGALALAALLVHRLRSRPAQSA
jgi:uncharacterized membrane protein YdjX (TVP38/TMEM64 family)